LAQALALSPQHLSLYSLTIEEGTPFAEWVASGDLPLPDDDLAADMYELAEEMLETAGYLHYEISNWAKRTALKASYPEHNSQFVCQHNLMYWRNEAYLGVGTGAHSSLEGQRWHNVLSPQDYVARMAEGRVSGMIWESPVVAGVEPIDEDLAMGETMMLGLRLLAEGVPLARFAARFGRSLLDVYEDELAALQAEGLLRRLPDRVRLTQRGRLLGNQVFVRFLPDS
jgi:oxygen-independent coproporphyrinogen-3 oxidase